MNKIATIAILENIVIMICFTFLAWCFNHWWIVLFSLLVLNTRIPTGNDKNEGEDKNEN